MTEQLINYFHKLTPCGEYQENLSYNGKNFIKQKYRYYTTCNLYSTIEGLCVNGGFHLDKNTETCVFLRRLKDNTLVCIWPQTQEVEISSEQRVNIVEC